MRRVGATPNWADLVEPMIEVLIGRSMKPSARKARVNVRAEILRVARFLDKHKTSPSGRYAYGRWTNKYREILWLLSRSRKFSPECAAREVRKILSRMFNLADLVNDEEERFEWAEAHGRSTQGWTRYDRRLWSNRAR
jgi:hypothetical protein